MGNLTVSSPPLLSFGLITDVQYADVDDGWNYRRTQQRYYRSALRLLKEAVAEWMDQSHCDREKEANSGDENQQQKPIKFAVNLGDLIDGKNRGANTTQAAIHDAVAVFSEFERTVGPVHHLLGNHELYNMVPADFDRQLRWSGASQTFYDFTMPVAAPHVRFVVLNCYGLSTLGRRENTGDVVCDEAYRLLRDVNPNVDLNSPLGLTRDQQRFVEYNGAVDSVQLQWLQGVLEKASDSEEDVIIFTHIPVHPRSCPWNCLLWNYQQVLDTIFASSCVRAVFSGHAHGDGYAQECGVHFVVNDAILECDPSKHETAHAIVDVHSDRLVVSGYGKIPSRVLMFPSKKTVQTDA